MQARGVHASGSVQAGFDQGSLLELVEGVAGSEVVAALELLVCTIVGEYGLEGTMHLHSRSYPVHFSHPCPDSVE
jgi:hypothetical protein